MIRRLSKMIVLAATAATIGGCTTTMAREFTSMQQTDRDIAECKYEAKRSSPENPLIAHDLAKQCLALRGYKKQ